MLLPTVRCNDTYILFSDYFSEQVFPRHVCCLLPDRGRCNAIPSFLHQVRFNLNVRPSIGNTRITASVAAKPRRSNTNIAEINPKYSRSPALYLVADCCDDTGDEPDFLSVDTLRDDINWIRPSLCIALTTMTNT